MKRFRGYPECRDSGVEWLGEIPAHWEVRRLKDHVEVNALVLPDDTDSDYRFDYVDIGSVEVGRLSSAVKAIRFGSSPSRARRVVRPGDTLVSTVRTYLKAVWTPTLFERDLIASTGFAVLTPNSDSVADYLGYFCQSDPFTDAVSAESVGIAYPAIAEAMLGFVPICVPPLPEQRAIADFLDDQTSLIDRLVRKNERLIDLLNEKRASLISHAVTRGLDPDVPMRDSGVEWLGEIPVHWEVVRLKTLSDMKSGESVTAASVEASGPYPVYGGNGLRGYTGHFTHEGEHLLIGRQGALCGNVHLVRGRFWASEHAVVVSLCRSDDVRWLGAILLAMDLNQHSIAAAQPGLAIDRVRELLIPIPSLPEQRAIADFLDRETGQIDALVTTISDAIKRLREYRSSVISAAVTGRIDVRDPSPPL